MKKLLLFAFLLPLFAHAQSCYSKKDEFTGKDIKAGMTFLISAAVPSGPSLIFTKSGDDLSIGFVFTVDLKPENFDVPNMIFLVKFANGEIKKFKSNKNSKVVSQTNQVIVGFQADLTADDLSYFKSNPVATIRLCYTGDEATGYDTKISFGKATKIMKSTECVLN